jgi:hypothetical protein
MCFRLNPEEVTAEYQFECLNEIACRDQAKNIDQNEK